MLEQAERIHNLFLAQPLTDWLQAFSVTVCICLQENILVYYSDQACSLVSKQYRKRVKIPKL